MRTRTVLSVVLAMAAATFVSKINAEEPGYGDDADPLAVPKIWTKEEMPERFKDENRQFQGIPSVQVTKDGKLWVTWFTGGPGEGEDNIVPLITSDDRGETWSDFLFAIDPQDTARAYDPTLWQDPNGCLWLFWAQGNISIHDAQKNLVKGSTGDKVRDCRAGVWCVTCEHPEAGFESVWTEPRRLCNGVMLNKPITDSQNRWLFPVAVWRRETRYPVDPETHIGPNVFVSTDQGKTLSLLGHSKLEAAKSGWDEHNIVELSDGRFWLAARVLNGMMEAYSSDQGKTWTDLAPSPVIKQTSSRFCQTKLQSGNILLVKNGPVGEDVGRNTIVASLSQDDGKTWLGPLVLDERDGVTYPNASQAPDGTIYVVWDHGRVKEKEILMARFTEDDVRAGEISSSGGKTKMLVNKAGK